MSPTRRRRGWIGRLVLLVLLVLLAWLAWEVISWPDVRALATKPPASTTFMERHKDSERSAGRSPRAEWRWVPSWAISIHLKRAAVVAEDGGFFRHHGFATAEMKEAALQALEERRIPRGASTITQQLAKNLWLSPSRSPLRKAREAILTWQLERTLSKRRILELYLNVAEFGPGVYGAEAASRIYFAKPASVLSPDEAAQLAAGLPRPRSWHPGVSSPAYRRYVETIRARMQRADLPERLLR